MFVVTTLAFGTAGVLANKHTCRNLPKYRERNYRIPPLQAQIRGMGDGDIANGDECVY